MENYEDQNFSAENEHTEEKEEPAANRYEIPESAYRGAGAGRKESPFADSPYVMNHKTEEQNHYGASSHDQTRYQPQYEAPKKPRAKKKKNGVGRKILAAVLALGIVAGSCGVTALLVNNYWTEQTNAMKDTFAQQILDLQKQIENNAPANTGTSISGSPVSADGSLTPSQVYAQNADAVVLVLNTATYSYFGQTGTSTSSGSGFIISADGYVLTNYHVVADATSLSVTLADGTKHTAAMIGGDETNDVALIKIEGDSFPYVSIGSSDDLIVGDQVVCIGNPLGELTNSLTVGYISAKDREVTTDGTEITMMQTDVAINSGNSGGPLFNMKGEVVGITTAKYSGSSSSGATIEGIGFAIPINDAMALVSDLKEFGYVKGAYMGVTISDMDSQTATLAEVYGLPVGPIIQSVEEGGAAAHAGIQTGDIVVKLDDTDISTVTELTRTLRNYEPGDTATIQVYRSGSTLNLTITFDEKPATTTDSAVQETTPESNSGGFGSGGGNSGGSSGWNPFFGWGN